MSSFPIPQGIMNAFVRSCDYRMSEDWNKPFSEYEDWLTDVLWPRSQLMNGSNTNGTAGDGSSLPQAIYYAWPRAESGARSCFLLIGQCLDVNGIPMGPCSLICHTTSDGVLRGACNSDSAGNYMCPTDISGAAHYVNSYYSTTMAGTSRKDLIPT